MRSQVSVRQSRAGALCSRFSATTTISSGARRWVRSTQWCSCWWRRERAQVNEVADYRNGARLIVPLVRAGGGGEGTDCVAGRDRRLNLLPAHGQWKAALYRIMRRKVLRARQRHGKRNLVL